MSLLFGELAIWLGALAVWLWPAYVRHRLMWGLWFWLHPETQQREVIHVEPVRQTNILSPEEYKRHYLDPAIQNMNAFGPISTGVFNDVQTRFIPSIGDWRSWYGALGE